MILTVPTFDLILFAAFWVIAVMATLFLTLTGWVAWRLREARRRLAATNRVVEAQDDLIRERETDLFYANERNAFLEARQHLFPEAEA